MADDCTFNTFNYNVALPIFPDIFFKVIFNCNGVIMTSDVFDNSEDALAWAQEELPTFGTWSVVDDTLYLSDSLCSTGSLSYQVVELDSEDVLFGTFTVTTGGEDVNLLLNSINDEELDIDSHNEQRDWESGLFHSRLLQYMSYGRLAIGLSDCHYQFGLVGDNTRINVVGKQINGILFKYGQPCVGGEPQFDATAILKGVCCGVYTYSFYGATLDRILEFNGKLIYPHNAEVNDVNNTLNALNEYFILTGDDAPIVIMGLEMSNPGQYINSTTYPNGVDDYIPAMEAAATTILGFYPDAKIILHAPKIFNGAAYITTWKNGLGAFTLGGLTPKLYIEQYYKSEDTYGTLSPLDSDDVWREAMKTAALVTFPQYIAEFKAQFPGFGLLIAAWGNSGGADAKADFNTVNSILYLGLAGQQTILQYLDDPTFLLGAAYYKPGSDGLTDPTPKAAYYAQIQYAKLFTDPSAKFCTVTTEVEGLYIIGSKLSSTYTLHIVNTTENDVDVENIIIDGDEVDFSAASGVSYYGSSLRSTTILSEAVSGTIRARSVTVVTITV